MRRIVTVAIVFLLLFNFLILFSPGVKSVEKEDLEVEIPQGYNYHDEITIDGDRDLKEQARENGWPGEGLKNDPYFIEKLFIAPGNEMNAISIRNTYKYIVIQDCILYENPLDWSEDSWYYVWSHGPSYPNDNLIRFYNVNNVTIYNCNLTFYDRKGIYLDECSDISIDDTVYNQATAYYWSVAGPFSNLIYNSRNISVTNCSFDLPWGRCNTFYDSENIILQDNEQTKTSGFADLEDCNNVTVSSNQFGEGRFGVFFERTNNSTVSYNDMPKTSIVGVYCGEGYNITISNNIFNGDSVESYGIYIEGSNDIDVIDNTMQDHDWALVMYNTEKNTIEGNIIGRTNRSIAMANSTCNTFTNNRMDRSGIWLEDDPGTTHTFTTQHIGPDNTVNGKPILYLRNKVMTGEGLHIKNWGQLILGNITGLTISDVQTNDISFPIQIGGCRRITISDCIFQNGEDMVYIQSSNQVEILRSRFSESESGSVIRYSGGVHFRDNIFDTSLGGCLLDGSGNCSFIKNIWKGAAFGIATEGCDNTTITENQFHNDIGIHLEGSVWNTVNNNQFHDSFPYIEDEILISGKQPSPSGNMIDGSPAYYFIGNEDVIDPLPQDGMYYVFAEIHGMEIGGLVMKDGLDPYFVGCSNVTIESFILTGDAGPLSLVCCSNMVVKDSTFRDMNADYSIRIEESWDCTIENNWVQGSNIGIHISSSWNIHLTGNDIRSTDIAGILIDEGSDTNRIEFNDIRWNLGDGICLNGTRYDIIAKNWIVDNTGYAINATSSRYATIYHNIFIRNTGSNETYNSSRTQVYVNNDYNQWHIREEKSNTNIGNYWYDLAGPDEDRDGFVDSYYIIPHHYGSDRDSRATSVPFYLFNSTRANYTERERIREEEEERLERERYAEPFEEEDPWDDIFFNFVVVLMIIGILVILVVVPSFIIIGLVRGGEKLYDITTGDDRQDLYLAKPIVMKPEKLVVFERVDAVVIDEE